MKSTLPLMICMVFFPRLIMRSLMRNPQKNIFIVDMQILMVQDKIMQPGEKILPLNTIKVMIDGNE